MIFLFLTLMAVITVVILAKSKEIYRLLLKEVNLFYLYKSSKF